MSVSTAVQFLQQQWGTLNAVTWAGLMLVALAFSIWWRFDLWRKKVFHPLGNGFRHLVMPYVIPEREVQRIECDENTAEVLVIVNDLRYEIDTDLGYDRVVTTNINRGVTYYYILPFALHLEWNKLRRHLHEDCHVTKQNLDTYLKVRFVSEKLTSAVMYGLAMYVGKTAYQYKKTHRNVVAIQYSPVYKHSFLVETSNPKPGGGRGTAETLLSMLTSSKSKFRSLPYA
jgi:hypothetical protein